MIDPQDELRRRFAEALAAAVGPEHADADPIIRPADPRFGDYQANLAMALAKTLGLKPRDLAGRIVDALRWEGLLDRKPEIAGPGFINLALAPEALNNAAAALVADDRLGVAPAETPATVVVDYSSPNVAKEMHVGHLRSTVIGDALARVLDFLGHKVIRQNHLGDWGTQFGMLTEYMIKADHAMLNEAGVAAVARGISSSSGGIPPTTHKIRDLNSLYKAAKRKFDEDPEFASRARQRVVLLQAGDERTINEWRALVAASTEYFNQTYTRLGVLLTDADIRGESFYNDRLADVVRELEAAGLIEVSDGAKCVFVPGYQSEDGKRVPLIVQKADGGFGYAATDLAGVRYRVRDLHADRIAYVVDARQSDHFAQVFWTAQRMGWLDASHTAEHVKFGTILGEDGKPFKTRSGDTVKLVDLLDEAEQRAAAIIAEKDPDLPADERAAVAGVIGIGAVKYGDLSGDRVKDYTFSWQRMLAFEGNTAPYLVNAYVRARSILRKAGEADAGARVDVREPAERTLVLKLVQFGGVVKSVADSLEPHRLCTYLYELAGCFHRFFEECPVIRAQTPQLKDSRLMLCEATARTLKQGLSLLGIETVERM